VPGPETWLSRAGSQCLRCWERWMSPVRRRVAAHFRSVHIARVRCLVVLCCHPLFTKIRKTRKTFSIFFGQQESRRGKIRKTMVDSMRQSVARAQLSHQIDHWSSDSRPTVDLMRQSVSARDLPHERDGLCEAVEARCRAATHLEVHHCSTLRTRLCSRVIANYNTGLVVCNLV